MQKIFCRHFVAESHVRMAFVIIEPPSLNQALWLGQGCEPMDIAEQCRCITDDVRANEAKQISQQQERLYPLHSLNLL
jgi:hypothetical protein